MIIECCSVNDLFNASKWLPASENSPGGEDEAVEETSPKASTVLSRLILWDSYYFALHPFGNQDQTQAQVETSAIVFRYLEVLEAS
ncbi:hypothetical protein RCL_jg4338.t1 [Rhizophagus clarus]|uniref:Uncharacterized protein n=1 Tax=Rhizophagus clarus TaxID=94130 RepID=A0A8H3QCJ0_9GLOM|nr:hypothetical protein RCL_jg4338.t1 [Rhizophagus clarus]